MYQAGSTEVQDYLFPSQLDDSPHLGAAISRHPGPLGGSACQSVILMVIVDELGLDGADYGTHSMRRPKATLIYRRTKNVRAVHLLLGHSKIESTVRYRGIEVDDALEILEEPEI